MKEDFFGKVRSTMMESMQTSLYAIRGLMHMSQGQLGAILGYSHEEIQRLEEGKDNLNEVQYVALCALIDRQMQKNERLKEGVMRMLQIEEENEASLLDRWLMMFDEEEVKEEGLVDGMELDENAVQILADEYRVFINYDSIKWCKGNETFLQFLKASKASNHSLYVLQCVIEKLQKDLLSGGKASKEAKNALSILNRLSASKYVTLIENGSAGTVEEITREMFCTYKSNYPMAMITENTSLAADLQTIGREMDGFDVRVISMEGNKMKIYDAVNVELNRKTEQSIEDMFS